MERRSSSWVVHRIRFTRIRDVKAPSRANDGDAGLDFYIPEDLTYEEVSEKNPQLIFFWNKEKRVKPDGNVIEVTTFRIGPGERILIPSGIRVLLEPKNSMLQANNKSGVSTKKGLIFTAEVVDSPYTGEIHIGVVNTSNKPVWIEQGEKLVQFVHIPIFQDEPEEISNEEYEEIAKDWGTRGDKGFGSSDSDKDYEDELNLRTY